MESMVVNLLQVQAPKVRGFAGLKSYIIPLPYVQSISPYMDLKDE